MSWERMRISRVVERGVVLDAGDERGAARARGEQPLERDDCRAARPRWPPARAAAPSRRTSGQRLRRRRRAPAARGISSGAAIRIDARARTSACQSSRTAPRESLRGEACGRSRFCNPSRHRVYVRIDRCQPSLHPRRPPSCCRGLHKRYGDVVAVDGLDLEVRAGECFGLLGPNGAGKTTTIEILEGLLDAGRGRGRGARPALGRRRPRAARSASASSSRRRSSPRS